MEVFLLVVFFLSSSVAARTRRIEWNGNWALGCDFRGNGLSSEPSKMKECRRLCKATSGCTHYVWTDDEDGICWMKSGKVSKLDAIYTGYDGMMCGVVETKEDRTAQAGVGRVLQNVLATRHGGVESGACALPRAGYTNNNPVALGNVPELQHLRFRPDLCGHILTINCGRGSLDIIVTNSNLGGGLDLYGRSTW